MAVPYTVSVDPQMAHDLATHGAAILALDVPPGTLFGINQHTFATGPHFKGVKMLPPSPHFISYRAVSQHTGAAPVTGFFLCLSPQQVVVRRWDPATETLVPLTDTEEEERHIAGVRRFDFDRGMAPYHLTAHPAWARISDMLTTALVERFSPPGGEMSIIAEGAESDIVHPRTQAERALVDQLTRGRQALAQPQQPQQGPLQPATAQQGADHEMTDAQGPGTAYPGSGPTQGADQAPVVANGAHGQQGPGHSAGGGPRHPLAPPQPQLALASRLGRCRYTPLPRLLKPQGASPAELTAMNMDKSALLEQTLHDHYQGHIADLLGELQFAFIAFVYGQTLGGYAQWKALVLLLLGCETAALSTHTMAFVRFLRILCAQLELGMGMSGVRPGKVGEDTPTPFGETLVEELLQDSFLKHMTGTFLHMLQDNDSAVPKELFQAAQDLKRLLRTQLGWDYDIQMLGGSGSGVGVGGEEDDDDAPIVVEDPEDFVRL